MKPSATWFFGRISPRRLGVHVRRASRRPRDRRAPPYWARPLSRGPLEHPPTDFFCLYKPTYPKNIDGEDRSGVLPPQASVATKNLSGACSGILPEGEPITGGHVHHPGAIHDEEGVVNPRGWGYVPVAMCLISLSLSLSRVLSMARSWCIASFAIIVGSYDVSPPLLSCNGLSFPFEVILSDRVFKDLRTLDVCLACAYLLWQWDITWSTWCMFWYQLAGSVTLWTYA